MAGTIDTSGISVEFRKDSSPSTISFSDLFSDSRITHTVSKNDATKQLLITSKLIEEGENGGFDILEHDSILDLVLLEDLQSAYVAKEAFFRNLFENEKSLISAIKKTETEVYSHVEEGRLATVPSTSTLTLDHVLLEEDHLYEPEITLTDGSPIPEDNSHLNLKENGQQEAYVVLSEDERAKGFVRPYRDSYVHDKCGTLTVMGKALSETYARDPSFYSGTYCCGCGEHFPVAEFHWYSTTDKVGS